MFTNINKNTMFSARNGYTPYIAQQKAISYINICKHICCFFLYIVLYCKGKVNYQESVWKKLQ